MRGTTPDARGTLPCFVSHLARCLHSPRRTGQPPSCRSSRSTPRTKMLCTVGGMADQTVTASSPLPERSPTLAAELPGLAARIDQLAGQARRAFEAMVKMIHFDHVLARTEETLIGFPKGTGGTLPKKFNAYGGDKAMPPKSSSEMRKDWIEATRGLSDELVRTTRIDMQRNTGGDRGNMRVLQLQLTNNKKRLAGACVRLPAEQSSQVTSAIVRDAFMKSQATLRVVEVKTTGKIEIGPHDFASTDEPETEPAAHPQRFVVGARDVAEASVGAGWRTCWSDSLSLGQGFHRETGGVAATAISYRPPAADPTWTAKLKGNITVATNSKEYTEMTTSGGSLSMEGWGASAEATLRDEANMKFKLNTVTGVVSMRYLSEKIDVINPANADQEVKLTGSAKTLLRTQGPIKFHDLHGSHFISGLTKGGSFVGSFAMEFESSESARDWKAELKADFESFGLRAGGSAEFEKKLDNIKECVKYQGQYTCVGWSTDHPPKLICSLADLATAHNQFDPSHGCNMEALLRRYEDLDDYRTTLAEYQGTDKVSFIKEENYGSISSALNVDYLRTNYLRRLLEGEGSDVLAAIHLRAVDTLKRIRNAVGLKAGISTVRANFHFLEVFMIKYEGDLNAKPNPEDVEAWEAGRALYLDLWCADDLERDLEAAAPPTVPRVPRNLGNGWTVDTSDGHLGFRYNGDQRLVLHSPHHPEHPDQVWVKRVGYIDTMLRDGDAVTIRSDRNGHRLQHSDTFQVRVAAANGAWDLPNPATFANANRGGWERLILEKL